MKTIALFGATGKTGRIIMDLLLIKGYKLKILVRNPSKISHPHPHIEMIPGNVLEKECVFKTLENAEAVINVIGHVKDCPSDLQTQATAHILEGMKQYNCKRLIDLTGGGVKIQGDHPDLIDRFTTYVMFHFAGKAMHNRFTDGAAHVELILGSEIDWTIVRAPVLIPGKAKGKTAVGRVGEIPGYSLRYADLAIEMVKIYEENLYIRECPYITNGGVI